MTTNCRLLAAQSSRAVVPLIFVPEHERCCTTRWKRAGFGLCDHHSSLSDAT
ncbi:hypothetical protein CONLIGDRAFT_635533 [Coniochaeta ligniaria NRRL 30616]|uniref:Uncharacterized protein n=1 Tax=Coniochaeta ligniaria NRRL 30616 TaxID=1408157 RepID=A0A1J7IDH7_9PEZI|nr:hypothetical protein CONLIGDRAFT_635533 [Coniochaeta ligniaria NRRL 30616]